MRGFFVAVAVMVAGCSSASPDSANDPVGPGIITDPTQGLNDTGAHIHDYWRGGDRLTFVDATHAGGDAPGTGPGFAQGQDIEVRSFQPDSGNVVPQGTASVEVTVSWTADDLDSYVDPVLYVKTAGTNATERAAAVENGVAVMIETGAPDADLPHQLLSAWLFELRMSSPDPMPLRFKGSVSLKADAVRGLPLPVFPAHPDPWKGTGEIDLIDASGQLSYFADTGDGGCNGISCPILFRPASGAIVPNSASYVAAELTFTGPVALELHYHSALSRDFARAVPIRSEAGRLLFELPIDGGGDGPYATQSQWEFTVLPAMAGVTRTAWMADYTLTASAIRG